MGDNQANSCYSRDLANGLRKIKSREKYTDFTICVGEKEFKCHRVVLAAVSEYFETMFDIGGLETESGRVCLDDTLTDENICEELLDYIYTGKDVVTMENADVLLHIAHMIQINSLHLLCKEFLRKNADKSNCVQVWQISLNHDDTSDLAELARSLILKHISEIANSKDKLDNLQNVDYLIQIFQSQNINTVDKSGLFLKLGFSWLNADLDERYECFPKLCKAMIENGVSAEDILEQKEANPELLTKPNISDEFEKLKQESFRQPEGSFLPPADDAAVIIGGNDKGNNCSVMCFSFRQKIWFSLTPLPLDPGFNFALCSRGLDLFVSGGSGPGPNTYARGGGATFLYFSGESNQWTELQSMPEKRQNHVMYAFDKLVYVFGGKVDDVCTKKVLTYNCDRNTWETNKTSLCYEFRSAAHACVRKTVYFMGGFRDTSNTQSNEMQFFDCQNNQSGRIYYSIPDCAKLNSKAVVFEGQIILICKNGTVLKCSEREETKTVAKIQGFDRKGFGAFSFEDKILICGGEASFRAQKDMMLCDIRSDLIQPIHLQESMPVSLSNFCYTRATVLRQYLTTQCETTMATS